MELKSERAVKDLLYRTPTQVGKDHSQTARKKAAQDIFLQLRAYPVKDWRGAACVAPLLTKTFYFYFCWAFLVLVRTNWGSLEKRGALPVKSYFLGFLMLACGEGYYLWNVGAGSAGGGTLGRGQASGSPWPILDCSACIENILLGGRGAGPGQLLCQRVP